MLPLIYTNQASAAVFVAACFFWLAPEIMGNFRQMARVSRKGALVRDRGSMRILIGFQWVGLAANFLLAWIWPAAAMAGPQTRLYAAGIVCIFLGAALRRYAIRTLGQFFTRDVAVSSDQAVVHDGPYRWIRHPAYSGTFLTMLGVGLAMTNWASLVTLLLCVVIGHSYRVQVEERALTQALGQPYIEYMRHTKRFIPGVL